MQRRRFLSDLGKGAALAALGGPLLCCGRSGPVPVRRAVVLGLDGLDPGIVGRLIAAGRAPNFKKLGEMGALTPLQTTMPALSPVAWSSFITGMTPGGHGIADFIMRDPRTYQPVFSIWDSGDPGLQLHIAGRELSLGGSGPRCLRKGKPFWAYLTEQGIPAVVIKMPTDFPVDDSATRAISGMGTPDLTDAYGTFAYYTSDPFEEFPGVSGGNVFYWDVVEHTARGKLLGPADPLARPGAASHDPGADKLRIDFIVYRDPHADAVRIDIQGRSVMLNRGEFSDWVKVEFDLIPHLQSVSGILRFLLKGVHPHLRLYVTPINIDPEAQPAPVTHPERYGAELAQAIGPYWTKGLPADTKAFDYGVFDAEDYVNEAGLILEERLRIFDYEWSRFESGLFFFYVSSTDQDAHMLWRNMDGTHPMHGASDLRFSGYLDELYVRMDRLLGEVLPAADDNTLILICSDHGFAQFGRQFHLNTWLREQGYLTLKNEARTKAETSYRDIDWAETLAYGMGFNGLYLNLEGREAQGRVRADKAPELAARLTRELENLLDAETGIRPVARVYPRDSIYRGAMTTRMAELFVGYSPGYRNSADSVLGGTGNAVIDINPWAWSGDHSMARDSVPGTLASSRLLKRPNPTILDLPVSILDFFGIARPAQMTGRPLF
jgi:predicted AlkP superfamily phosphohydrolase/phosphomutase